MAGLGLQMQNTAPLLLSSGDPVLFNEVLVDSDPNISYQTANGQIHFAGAGEYYVSWFVVIKTAGGVTGADFSIVTNESVPKYYSAGSGFKNGEITGFALLDVTDGFEISLQNASSEEISLHDLVQANAGISILNAVERGATGMQGPTGPTASSIYVQPQEWLASGFLSHSTKQK